MAAGLQLKNHLVAKDPTIKLAYQQRWRSFPEETRNYIKKNVSKITNLQIPELFYYYRFNAIIPETCTSLQAYLHQ